MELRLTETGTECGCLRCGAFVWRCVFFRDNGS